MPERGRLDAPDCGGIVVFVTAPEMTGPTTSSAEESTTTARPGLNRFASRGPHRIAYELVPGDRPDAPVVLLLHGLLAGRGEWAIQRAAFAGRFALVLPEARGHGASAALSDRHYAVADLVAETLAVLEHAGVERAHLVGHGLGGATAWELAATVPERVRSLTLIEPDLPALLDGDLDSLAGSTREEERQAARAAADAAYQGLIDQALDAYLAPRRGPDWRDRLSRPEQAAFRRHAASLPAILAALDAHTPTVDAAPDIPTLLVHGSAARPLARWVGARITDLRAATRLETVPTGGPGDSPLAGVPGEALSRLLLAFLTDPEASRSRRPGN